MLSSPFVCIPGFMLDTHLWDTFAQALPTTTTINKASYGDGETIQEIAHDIANTLAEPCVLIGFSLGGYIARQIAADFPEKVKRLVLIASSLREDTPEQTRIKQQALNMVNAQSYRGLSHKTIAHSLHTSQAENTVLIRTIKDMSVRLGYEALVRQTQLKRADVPTAVRCPTLIMASQHDRLRTLEEAKELERAIPNSTFTVLENSGHMIPLEEPRACAHAILTWLKDV